MTEPVPVRAKKRGGWKVRMVKKFILANPTASTREVARTCKAAERTVGKARRELFDQGLTRPADRGRPPLPRNEAAVEDLLDVEELIRRDIDAAIATGSVKVLTREERRQRLSQYADHPKVSHQSKIAALRELEATEPKSEEKQLGPGAPLTTADRIHRVSLMIEALLDIDGAQAVNEAYEKGTGHTVPVGVEIIHVPMHVHHRGINVPKPERQPAPVDDPVLLNGSAVPPVEVAEPGALPLPPEFPNEVGGVHEVVEGVPSEPPEESSGLPDTGAEREGAV